MYRRIGIPNLGTMPLTGMAFSPGVASIRYQSGEIGNVSDTVAVITFSKNVNSPGVNYMLGVTVYVNAIVRGLVSGVRQADNRVVYYTLASAVVFGDVVTWEYDAGVGDLEASDGSGILVTVPAQTLDNNVASALSGEPIGLLLALTYA